MPTNTKKATKAMGQSKVPHSFKNVRDTLCENATAGTLVPASLLTNSSGGNFSSTVLAPNTLIGCKVSGGTVSEEVVLTPALPWLYRTAVNFASFRVTRATLVFVGNVGSTTPGFVAMKGYKDPADAFPTLTRANAVGANVRSFNLAESAGKEIRLPLPVDSRWKRNTSYLSKLSSTYPFTGTSGILNFSTVGDASFTSFALVVVGGPASTNVGELFLEYDVEFAEPISLGTNA